MTKKRKNATIITRENSGEGAVYGRVCFRRTASVIRGRGDRPRGRGEARLGAGITPRNSGRLVRPSSTDSSESRASIFESLIGRSRFLGKASEALRGLSLACAALLLAIAVLFLALGCGQAAAQSLTPTTTTLSSSQSPAGYYETVTLTANVSSSGGTPTGTVNFYANSSSIGSATLSGGQATSTTTVSSSANPSSVGQAVVFSATVIGRGGAFVSGNVIFYDGGTAISGPISVYGSNGATGLTRLPGWHKAPTALRHRMCRTTHHTLRAAHPPLSRRRSIPSCLRQFHSPPRRHPVRPPVDQTTAWRPVQRPDSL